MHSFVKLRRRGLATVAAVALAAPGLLALTAPTASASIPSGTAFKSSEPFGTWNNGAFDVYNNEWNTSEAGPQTIWAYSYHHWGVESTQSASTSVKTYPSVQRNYPNGPITPSACCGARSRRRCPRRATSSPRRPTISG